MVNGVLGNVIFSHCSVYYRYVLRVQVLLTGVNKKVKTVYEEEECTVINDLEKEL